ncbi:hypothetical protein C8R41DRAFT_816734 [Lentinula lateritia]|uniref:Uncharacterized protein n=1 Tax=Lentinula lateritia TaxID=40482 RepID=A0ABQ8VTC4_9AGAR|nr:hypothetical protein C8R41DRAFT_816734 [Lentinula lateritia]
MHSNSCGEPGIYLVFPPNINSSLLLFGRPKADLSLPIPLWNSFKHLWALVWRSSIIFSMSMLLVFQDSSVEDAIGLHARLSINRQ